MEDWEIGFQAFYTTEDLSDASYLDVRTNLPPYTPLTLAPVPKDTKLIKPKISIDVKRYRKNTWMVKIRIKKYGGTNIEIYYQRGKGKFKKIKLKRQI